MRRKKRLEMEIINPNAAGIDIGSRSHFVAAGQSLDDVKEFGVYAGDLESICLHLKEYEITAVAMESTGDYWQNLFICNGNLNSEELAKHRHYKLFYQWRLGFS
jgi:transposase